MPAKLTVLLGPARSGKTLELVRAYRQALQSAPATGGIGRAIWLAPNSRAAATVREQLFGSNLRACLVPGITTFDALADRLVSATANAPRRLSPTMERALLRRVVQNARDAKKLGPFADAASRDSFSQLLAEHFDELQCRGIQPRGFAKTKQVPRGDRAQNEALAWLYAEYIRQLDAHRLSDSERRLSAADQLLADDADLKLLGDLAIVVADGFTDFSAVQHALLKQLAAHTQNLLIALPGESNLPLPLGEGRSEGALNARSDLFAKSAATLAELRRHHPKLIVRELAPRAGNWPALEHAERNLFRHPRDLAPPSQAVVASLDRFEIIESAGSQDEIVQLARLIKRQLLDATYRPGEIAVVFRSLHDAAPRIRAVFTEFGIPFALESGLPLAATAVVRTLLDFLRLDADNWPFRRVVSVITNNLLASLPRKERAATEWIIRDLQVVEGRDTLLTRIDRLANETPPAGEPASAGGDATNKSSTHSPHHAHQIQTAATALPFLRQLAAALEALPQTATPTAWTAALTHLGNQLGIEALQATPSSDPQVIENQLAWQHVVDHFASLERLATWLEEPPPQLARRDVIDTLIDIAANERLPRPHDDVGRVRILSAGSARTVEAKHLILAGMSEQAFPSPERIGRFYSEEDYAAFARVADQSRAEDGAPPVRRANEEMLLFYEVVTRATERLTISYPALDEKAQPLPPSPYVTELERTFGTAKIERRGAPRPSPLPPNEAPLSPSDWRIGAVARAVLDKSPELASLTRLFTEPSTRYVANSLDAALRIIADRGPAKSNFGPSEGILAGAAVRQRLARRFGKDHLWSPTQFETYARCPYHFFMHDVLGLEPVGELVLESDPRRRGSMLHQVLADFHRDRPELFHGGSKTADEEAQNFVAEFTNVIEALMRATPYSGIEAALAELDRLRIQKWAPQYFGQQAGYRDAKWPALDEPLTPAHFEWRFGPPRSDATDHEDPRSTAEPYSLDLGDEKIRLTGRIDRIDVGRRGERTVFNVIDYKSGKKPSLKVDKIKSGERLQPALYVMAARSLLFGIEKSTPLWAGYWSMNDGVTTRPQYSLQCSEDGIQETDAWQDLQKSIVERVRTIVNDIRGGQFPVTSLDEHCTSYCDFRTVCRIAQTRALNKPWPPII